MNDREDEIDLIRRTAEGDALAFRKLADLYLGKIMNYSCRLLRDRAEGEDVAQETFVRVWKEAGSFEPRARVGTWIHRIAHNLCIDRLRARREQPTDLVDEIPSPDEPSGLLEQKQMVHTIDAALAELPERQRAAVTLVHYQGLNNIEAAEVLGVGVEAIESLLGRGRRALRERLARTGKSPRSEGGSS